MDILERNVDFKPFEKIDITTSVISSYLKSDIDFMILFLAYPCSPYSKKKGAVNYMRCHDQSRGVNHKVEKDGKFFKNSTMLVVRVNKDKIINIKVFENRLHISGSKSLDDTKDCLLVIMKNIYKIKKNIQRMKKNMVLAQNSLDWFINQLRGSPCLVTKNINLAGTKFYKKRKMLDFNIKKSKSKNIAIPDFVDKRMIKFFLGCTRDIILSNEKYYLSQLKNRLQYLIDSDVELYDNSGPLLYEPLSFHMANLNTSLWFKPNRRAFRDIFTENGICASYVNSLSSHTKIQISIIDDKYVCKSKHKKKSPRCTILVHRTGKVTHSSPHIYYLEQAYNLFNTIVLENKERLTLVEP